MRALLALVLLASCAPVEGEVAYADPDSQMIIGGEAADLAGIEAIVSVQDLSGNSFCGGTLIDPFWVVTAAHCLNWATVGAVRVEVGSEVVGEGTVHTVASWIMHPDYRMGSNRNDIALLRLGTPIEDVAPMPLLTRDGEDAWAAPGTLATVAGWGDIDMAGTSPDTLQSVEVPLVELDTCQALYVPTREVLDTMVCAGDVVNGGVDSCSGDSGGPLFIDTDVGTALYGVVSWGVGCAEADHPGVYTRVPSFVNWIQHEVYGTELDDYGDSVGNAEPLPVNGSASLDGSFLVDDIDTFALQTTDRYEVVVTTTSTLDITARVVRSDGAVLAVSTGIGDAYLVFELDGNATLELEGATEGDYVLDVEATHVGGSSGSGCSGSNLGSTLLMGSVAMGGRRGRQGSAGRGAPRLAGGTLLPWLLALTVGAHQVALHLVEVLAVAVHGSGMAFLLGGW